MSPNEFYFHIMELLMTTLHRSFAFPNVPGLYRLAEEVSALLDALLHPNELVAQVEQIRKLQLQADRIEASDPAQAALLRQRAARILS